MNYIRFTSLCLSICLSISFFLAPKVSFSQSDIVAKEQIKLVLKFQENSWNRGDIAAYMEGYWNSDSLLFIGSKGPTYGWMKTFKNYLESYPNQKSMGKLSFTIHKLDLLSKHQAFVVGQWKVNRKEDDLRGYFSLLWRKINGEWKIIVDHSSSE